MNDGIEKEVAWMLFAASAMQGLIAAGNRKADITAEQAAEFANAMMHELTKAKL